MRRRELRLPNELLLRAAERHDSVQEPHSPRHTLGGARISSKNDGNEIYNDRDPRCEASRNVFSTIGVFVIGTKVESSRCPCCYLICESSELTSCSAMPLCRQASTFASR